MASRSTNLLGNPRDTIESIMQIFFANLFIEAAVVGVVCIVFLILMIVAGIKQILDDRDR